MAVMASSLMDKPSFESKPLVPSSKVVSLESDINGLAPNSLPNENGDSPLDQAMAAAEKQSSLNGRPADDVLADSIASPAPANESTRDPPAPLFTDTTISTSDPISEIPPAVEAPISDLRADTITQRLPQLPAESEADVMDTADRAPHPEQADSTIVEEVKIAHDATLLKESSTTNTPAPVEFAPSTDTQTSHGDEPLNVTTGDGAPTADEPMEDAPPQSKVRAREDDEVEEQPSPKRLRTAEAEPSEPGIPKTGSMAGPATASVVAQYTPVDENPSSEVAPTTVSVAHNTQYVPKMSSFDSEPMTPRQKSGLVRVLAGARKAKISVAFKDPVDPVALGIPTYPDIVKHPMDLKTMEMKLKEGQYGSVDDFIADMCQIVQNTVLFNGIAHAVSQSGLALEAYMVKSISTNAARSTAQTPQPPKQTPPAPEKKEMRRRSTTKPEKPAIPQPTPVAPSPTTYAPIDGVPIIRRDSTTHDGRPKREIQRPKPRDLPYSVKPKKKKFQVELRFCEYMMNEVKKQKYARIAWPFANPVDPVALNIPTYHKVIKKPMDMSTIDKKLKQGDYQTSKDFKADLDLMFANCFKFNPDNDEINKMGREFQVIVNELWAEKDTWVANHQPPSDPVSSAEESEDDGASEDEQDTRQRDLLDIQRQIAMLNSQAQQIIESATKQASPKVRGKKSGKAGKNGKSKKGSSGLTSTKPSKSKKAKNVTPLTFQQKQEISESISELSEADMGKAMQIIRNGCPNLSNGNDEELEIDMEMIPEDVLRQLYKFVHNKRPSVQKNDDISDDEFEPPKSAAPKASKGKKNKPMNKKEQEDNIEAIKRQLESFKQGFSGSEEPISPANQDDSSSDDDADSESEEE